MNFIGICCLQFVEIMPFIFFVSLDENDPKGTTFLCSPRDFLVVQYFRGLAQSDTSQVLQTFEGSCSAQPFEQIKNWLVHKKVIKPFKMDIILLNNISL